MIRRLFKWMFRLALVVVVLVVLLLAFRDSMLRSAIEHRIHEETGMTVKIGRLSTSLLSPTLTLENLKLHNTSEWGGMPFLDVPELHIELDRGALLRRELHFKLVRLNWSRLDVVRNEAGRTNLFQMLDKVKKQNKQRTVKERMGNFEFTGIDTLNLTLGRVTFIDLKDARNNCENVIDFKHQIFNDVKTQEDFNGILQMLFLRNGGGFCFTPNSSLQDLVRKKLNRLERDVRRSIEKAGATPQTPAARPAVTNESESAPGSEP